MIRKMVRIVTVVCTLALFAGNVFAQAASPAPAQKSTRKTSATPKSKQVDINAATKEQLTAVSGIDDATAQKIIGSRPYKTKKDLVTKKILTQDQYAKVKDQLVAHGGRKASGKAKSTKGASMTPTAASK